MDIDLSLIAFFVVVNSVVSLLVFQMLKLLIYDVLSVISQRQTRNTKNHIFRKSPKCSKSSVIYGVIQFYGTLRSFTKVE